MKSKKILLAILVFLGMILLGTSKSSAMSADEAIDWVKGQCGQTIYGGECVGLIQAYYDHLGLNRDGVYGNACDYATNKVPDGCTRLQGVQPQKGDILVYTGGTYGHVAIYESDYVTYHQNYSGRYVRQISNYYQNMYVYWNSQTDYLKLNYWGVIRPSWGDSEKPVLSNIHVHAPSIGKDKINVRVHASDNVGVTAVKFSAWQSGNSDTSGTTKWASYNTTDGCWETTFTKAEAKIVGDNIGCVQAWAYDAAGNESNYDGVYDFVFGQRADLESSFVARIVSKVDSNYCIGISGTNNGDDLKLKAKNQSDDSQLWAFTKNSDGTYRIINLKANKSFDTDGGVDAKGDGTVMQIWDYANKSAQMQYVIQSYNGGYRFVPTNQDRVRGVDLKDGKVQDNQPIIVYQVGSKDNKAQTWTFEKVATSISMNVSSAVVRKGETKQLSVKLNPTDVANKSVKWTTSNSQIATVSSTGVVKGIKEGKVTITATTTDGSNKKATCNVTITLPFKDLSPSDWEYSAVEYMYNRKYISGTSATTFSPNMKLTRGMLVTILHNMEGKPYVAGKCKFPDVQNTQEYYYNAIKWASSNKIVSGYNNGKFGPNDNITREQLAVILWKYSKYKGTYKTVKADYSKFTDSKNISSFAKEGMNWAVGAGVITGSNKKLNPQGYATRSEAVSMIYKYCTKVKK